MSVGWFSWTSYAWKLKKVGSLGFPCFNQTGGTVTLTFLTVTAVDAMFTVARRTAAIAAAASGAAT